MSVVLSEVDVPEIEQPATEAIVALSEGRPVVELDASHNADIKALRAFAETNWDADLRLLQSHTAAFQKVYDSENRPGRFSTSAPGTELSKPNCFAYPLFGGGWEVYRYTQGHREADTWEQDGESWTHCTFGVALTFRDAIEDIDATEDASGAFLMSHGSVIRLARMMGHKYAPPDIECDVLVKFAVGNRLKLVMEFRKGDPEALRGWVRKKTKWESVVGKVKHLTAELLGVRCVSSGSANLGYTLRTNHGYQDASYTQCMAVLINGGLSRDGATACLGASHAQNRLLVNEPFGPEYPSAWKWNRFAAQFRYKMAEADGPHPHYDMVLRHVGSHLTPAVVENRWCKDHGIKDGGEYLLNWSASMYQRPFQLLPYLYLYGPQDCGKSSLSTMHRRLMTRGAEKIDKVFMRGSTFDSELSGTLLGSIEEANLTGRNALTAYNKIKDLTTAEEISIERKGWDAFVQRNCLHIIQNGNHPHYCPILDADDSRIVVMACEPLSADQIIVEPKMRKFWVDEAPYFIRTMMTLKLPPLDEAATRLYFPILHTPAKGTVIESVRRATSKPDNVRSVPSQCDDLANSILSLVSQDKIVERTTAELLADLRSMGVQDLPDSTRKLGQAIRKLAVAGLKIDEGRTHDKRWFTITKEAA